MMDMNMDNFRERIMNKYFRRVDDVVWDLQTGKVGVNIEDGIATLEGEGDDAEVVVNIFDNFGIPIPAFAQNTPVDQINKGDLIYNTKKGSKEKGWVIETPAKDGKIFKLLKTDGTRGEWRPPKQKSLGLDLSGAMVLRSLVNTLPEGGFGNMQNLLMPMLMGGMGDFDDLEEMLPMMLMSQTGGFGGESGGSGDMSSMMQNMMMMKMMGGMGSSGKKRKSSTPAGGGGNFFDRDR